MTSRCPICGGNLIKNDVSLDRNKKGLFPSLYCVSCGYRKDLSADMNIKISVEDGYLTVQATIDSNHEEKENGKFVRRERYTGSCSRSFYVGEDVESEDIKASFKNGILNLEIPKKEEKKLPEKKYIQIDE